MYPVLLFLCYFPPLSLCFPFPCFLALFLCLFPLLSCCFSAVVPVILSSKLLFLCPSFYFNSASLVFFSCPLLICLVPRFIVLLSPCSPCSSAVFYFTLPRFPFVTSFLLYSCFHLFLCHSVPYPLLALFLCFSPPFPLFLCPSPSVPLILLCSPVPLFFFLFCLFLLSLRPLLLIVPNPFCFTSVSIVFSSPASLSCPSAYCCFAPRFPCSYVVFLFLSLLIS